MNTPAAVDLRNYSSIMAGHEAGHLSSKYQFVPTMRLVEDFASKGWRPVKATEVATRLQRREGYQKHLIRFRNADLPEMVRGIYPEVVLTNSHDGSATFNVMAGLFRLICSNGLVVADSLFGTFSIRHLGYTHEKVHQAIDSVLETVPKIAARVKEFDAIVLTPDEQGIYAASALEARYGEEDAKKRDFRLDLLVKPVREQDKLPTLWNTYNTIQEKFINGARFVQKTRSRVVKNRGVGSINENIRINKALWMLTEKMAELKRAS